MKYIIIIRLFHDNDMTDLQGPGVDKSDGEREEKKGSSDG